MSKSIVITSNAYYPNIGGVENSLRYLANSFKKMGYNVIVIVSDISNKGVLPPSECIDGITIYRYPTYTELSGLSKFIRPLKSAYSAYKIYKKVASTHDIAMTLSRFHTNTVIAKLAKLPKIKYLVPGVVKNQNNSANLISSSGLIKLKLNISKLVHHNIQKAAFYCSHSVFVFSENMKAQIHEINPKLITPIVKPGVDTERFSPIEIKEGIKIALNIPLDKTILLTVGRFVKAKGFDIVIDAIEKLPNCHLVMVGDGENMLSIRKQIHVKKLENRITLAGSQSDTAPYYQLADIFLMSSIYEPLGQTILEALASGLPIIAFKGKKVKTATEELLTDDEAIFTDNVSEQGISDAVLELLSNETLMHQLSIKSRSIAKERFCWDVLANSLLTTK